jgi:hypothetical protein
VDAREQLVEHLKFLTELGIEGISRDPGWRASDRPVEQGNGADGPVGQGNGADRPVGQGNGADRPVGQGFRSLAEAREGEGGSPAQAPQPTNGNGTVPSPMTPPPPGAPEARAQPADQAHHGHLFSSYSKKKRFRFF